MGMTFITENDSFGKYIDITSRHLFYYISKKVEKYNLQKHQFKILVELYHKEGLCQEELVEQLKIRKPEVAKAVKKLVEMEYIYKEKNQDDRRYHHLYISDKGLEIKDEIIAILNETTEILVKDISEEDLLITKRVLEKVTSNIIGVI